MARIRNISPTALIIGIGFPAPRRVEPDDVVIVPDDLLSSYVDRHEGITGDDGRHQTDENGVPQYRVVPSDLWAEVVDVAPAVPAPVVEGDDQ